MKYSEKDAKLWYFDYKKGLSQRKIADKHGVSPETIKKYFEIYNIDVDWNAYHVRLSKKELKKYQKARKLYINGCSMRKAREQTGISSGQNQGFKNYLRRTGIKIKSLSEVASFVENHNFFSNIDNEIKAYLLGFFAADGHIEKRKDYDSYTLRIAVKKDDAHILMLYNNFITNGKSAISVNKHNIASIAITSKKIGEDLLKLGFDSNKTKNWNEIPKLKRSLYPHFIRGFFDGDGSVSVNNRKNGKRLSGLNRKVTFSCYSKNILKQISSICEIDFNYRQSSSKNKKIKNTKINFSACHIGEIWNFEDLKKFYKYLYSNAEYYYFRKKQKFDLAILSDKEYYATLQGNLY